MATLGLIDLEGMSLISLLSRRPRRELCVEFKSKHFDRLLVESSAQDDDLPTYGQATKIDVSSIERSSA